MRTDTDGRSGYCTGCNAPTRHPGVTHAEWTPPAPFVAGSDTSKEAAEQIRESAETLRWKVFGAIERAGPRGLTDLEVQDALSMDGNTERPRRIELVAAKRIKDSGLRRKTKKGRNAVVWVKV